MEVSNPYDLKPGDQAPEFELPEVGGGHISRADFAGRPLVVAFWCNHCPYVHAYEDRVIAWAKDTIARGVGVLMVNSNDEVNYPEDSFDHMVKRAATKGYPFHYARDKDQSVATAYGGRCTPHFLLFDADHKLVYQGRFDDSKDDAGAVKEHYLPDAVDALLAGAPQPRPHSWAIGCSIKWG